MFSSNFRVQERTPHGSLRRTRLIRISFDERHRQEDWRSERQTAPMPQLLETPVAIKAISSSKKSYWPWVKGILGLLVGVGFLLLVFRLVDLPATLRIITQQVRTARGMVMTLLASTVFVLAFTFRALRWKLFLNPVQKVRTFTVIRLFLIGVFLNFLLPIRAGELAKSLILKRSRGLPISQSLPTITMDKAFDLLPALFLLTIVPLLGVQLDSRFWYVLWLASACLIGLIFFICLAAWKRSMAHSLLHKVTAIFPGGIGGKIESLVTNFVDAMLLSARDPRILFSALLLTAIAVTCDGLYNFFAFWAIGYPITVGEAIFGYMLFNLFYILPNPPGQVGSNEVVGLLIFTGLLHIPADSVTAMVLFFHSWSGVLMCAMGLLSLSTLKVSFSSMLKVRAEGEKVI
ncbi:MAG TPA: lysylphosphatidylglycerol synthase transmembrane domain-containing protein [Ktedonobacteraceae bacterium]|jgi:uncharacterized protein (TIRG00374 family)|nr:lysylphosphatidylglycerol synthase transmembrane domain-containing protein [Ktedonobacteraceae bacterium]